MKTLTALMILKLSFIVPTLMANETVEVGRAKIGDASVIVSAERLQLNQLLSFLIKYDSKAQHKNKKPVEFHVVSADVRMPEHNHGMLVKPVLTKSSQFVYTLNGVKLHMPGSWSVILEVSVNKKSSRIEIPFLLR